MGNQNASAFEEFNCNLLKGATLHQYFDSHSKGDQEALQTFQETRF